MRTRIFLSMAIAAAILTTQARAAAIVCQPDSTATVCDLGLVAYDITVRGAIELSPYTETYTYQQLVFGGVNGLGITFDSGMTLDQVLTAEEGAVNDGNLVYNFPMTEGGASGAYVQNGGLPAFPGPSPTAGPLPGVGPGILLSFTALPSQSGTVCTGANSAGSMINLDPTNGASTLETILGCDSISGIETTAESTTVSVTIPLGTIGDVMYVGEVEETDWTVSQTSTAATPEPSSLLLAIIGSACVCAIRKKRYV